jgi:hypothetical protein
MSSRFPGMKLNPRNLFVRTRFQYDKLPTDSQSSSPLFGTPLIKSWKQRNPWSDRRLRPRMSLSRIIMLLVTSLLLASMLGTGIYKRHTRSGPHGQGERVRYHWERYPR